MTERKKLLLRLDPDIYAAIARWAADDLRSVNAQIEYALRRALEATGRAPRRTGTGNGDAEAAPGEEAAPGDGAAPDEGPAQGDEAAPDDEDDGGDADDERGEGGEGGEAEP
jgi:hypothetical protein